MRKVLIGGHSRRVDDPGPPGSSRWSGRRSSATAPAGWTCRPGRSPGWRSPPSRRPCAGPR
ncbi:hypothetical protein [Ornithinimicrobium kibberense]|uniref:hypothetical protein n=1 Tax=Ornithinimicrobium kibberense TaxID=282060 RepID=UPI00360C3230